MTVALSSSKPPSITFGDLGAGDAFVLADVDHDSRLVYMKTSDSGNVVVNLDSGKVFTWTSGKLARVRIVELSGVVLY